MNKLTVKTEFEVTTTSTSKIFAKVGDVIFITNKDAEHYNILKINNTRITSRWMRKSWIDAKCN